ncbi:6708_t:CDS:2 [Entrophospora sp. SA101]|nr:6708_t:CDS:2 [Entrophospora sp. SA101]
MNSLFSGSDANKIIVGTKSTKFYAIDPTTKKLIKTFDNNERDNENECPFLPKDALYICMNAPNGDILSTNSYSTRNEWHQVLRSPLKVDNNDDETCQLGSPLYPSCIEGPSPLSSPSSSSPSLENNYSSSASPSIDKADSIISLTRIGFSLFSIILLIFIGIIYWNKYNNKNGRHFFNKLSLTPLLGTIAQKYNDFNETFFSDDSSGNGINQVKSNKKEVGNKKKKKGNKNHNHNNINANNKKVELKNDDLKINGTTTSNKETTITNNNNSQNLDLHTVDHEKILVVEGIDQYEVVFDPGIYLWSMQMLDAQEIVFFVIRKVIQYLQMIGLAEEGRVVIAKRYGDDKDV